MIEETPTPPNRSAELDADEDLFSFDDRGGEEDTKPVGRRFASWLSKVSNPGVMWVAFPVAIEATALTGSFWPAAVWLVTALAAEFDKGWNRAR